VLTPIAAGLAFACSSLDNLTGGESDGGSDASIEESQGADTAAPSIEDASPTCAPRF